MAPGSLRSSISTSTTYSQPPSDNRCSGQEVQRRNCHLEADMMRSITVLALALVLGAGTTAARAHAMLAGAQPRVGSSVSSAPRQVTLSFTQQLEPGFSSI